MLEEIIGQTDLKRSFEIAAVAARRRNEVLEHLLLCAIGGIGKTYALNAFCRELGYYKAVTQGNRLTIAKVKSFLVENCLAAKQRGIPAFLIIDEIHEMSPEAQDELFYPMDHGTILTLEQPVKLWPFCLAGATTDPHELDGKSLIDRFVHTWEMKDLTVGELMTIVSNFLRESGLVAQWAPMQMIAERSKGSPRLAKKYVRRARDFAQYEGRTEVTSQHVERMFSELGIDDFGLDGIQRRYLTILYESGKPVGKEALASMLGEMRPEQLTRMVEPFLWKSGFITSTNRGRSLTDKGFKHLARSFW